MRFSQLTMEFDIVYQIEEKYGDTQAAKHLLAFGESWVISDLKGFNCIEEKNGQFRFVVGVEPYSHDLIRNEVARTYMTIISTQTKERLKKKLDGD